MGFNSMMVVSVAEASAEAWQWAACMPERLSREQLVDLLLCFPLQHLGRLALYLWTFLCFPPSHHHDYSYDDSSSSSSSSSSSAVDFNDYYYHSHSD